MGRSDRESAIARMVAIFADVDAGSTITAAANRNGCEQPYASRICRYRRTLQRGEVPGDASRGTVNSVREAMKRVARQRRGTDGP